MNISLYVSFASVLAVCVGISILTIGASALLNTIVSVYFAPRSQGSKKSNRVFDIECNDSHLVRVDLQTFSRVTPKMITIFFIVFLAPIIMAMVSVLVFGYSINDLWIYLGKNPKWYWRVVPWISISVVPVYIFYILRYVLKIKANSITILSKGIR